MSRIVGAGGGGGGCFLGHTLVRTPDGLRAIETLQPGDLVLSFDDQGELHQAAVLKVHVHEGERVVRYRLWGGAVLDATPNHWVLNQFNAFVEIGTLGGDDCLVDENGHLRPIVERSEFCVGTVYNLTVEGHHTFIAGGIRVHNAGLGLGIAGSGGGGGGGGKGGGGGGGGGSTRTPTEAADNLNSTQFANLVDLISEGEIQGLKDGHKSIFIGNTPLQSANGTYNFKNVTVHARTGTQNQSFIPIAGAIEDEKVVNVTVYNPSPVVRTVTDTSVDAVRVTIYVPQLQQFTDEGDIVGASIQLRIAVQYNGGGYTTVIDNTISGRTGDAYQRDYLVNLTGAFPVDIKVTRVTEDSDSAKLSNSFNWSSYTEIIYARLRYPNSAVIGLRVDAEQFSSIPARSYLIRGIKVKIPNNATVDSTTGRLIYSGVWNGTFGAAAWTTDPAWILWDLLTSKRYGFGDHIQAAQLDKWAFYSASVYASALVPDGSGGTEPRFSCNVNIQTAEEAYKLINDMCSVFRAMPYWSTGALTITQDRPSDSAYLFTSANVSEQGFAYSSSGLKGRPTVAVVSYLDLDLRDIAYEVVEDQAGISKFGVVTSEISAFACTSRGQAQRLGEWLLYSEKYEGEVISFTASIDAGVVVRPGQIIDVADPVKAGQRRGGRIRSATTTAVTIDDTTGVTTGSNRTLSVILPNGTVETRNVSSISGNVITVSTAFSTAPNANSIWIYQTNDLRTTQWRVLSVTEREEAQYDISALAYNSSKYAYIEQNRPLQLRDTTNLNVLPAAPTNLVLSEALYQYQGQVRAKVLARWKPVVGVSQYRVRWRKASGNWASAVSDGPDFEVLNITPGTFSFEIYSLNSALKLSTNKLTGSINALGKTAPPSNVSGFTHVLDPSLGVTLSWTAVADIDLSVYEIRRGASWDAGTLVTRVAATSYKIGYLDDGAYTYWIKARDTSNVYSTTASSRSITITVPSSPTVTAVIDGSLAKLNWSGVSGSYNIKHFIVRYGNTFAAGTTLGTFQTTSASFPVTWSGTRTFWVAAVDLVDNTGPASSVAVVNNPAPAPTVSSAIVGNSVTLSWTAVSGTIATQSYEIRVGATYATATVLATIQSTAYSLNADWVGSRTYWIAAEDTNGNLGTAASHVVTILAAPAPSIDSAFFGEQAQLTWTAVKGSLETAYYQIRRGSTFASATVLATIQGTAFNLKVDWGGTEKFWVAAFDVNNSQGTPGSIDVVVTVPSAPSISQQVIDNNVLLRWTDSTQTLPLVSYELRRGATWATATVIGTKQGRFTTVFETASGTYTYWLAGIDTAGNYGTPGSAAASVNQPPDYVLQLDQNSTWAGAETNIFTDPDLGQVVNVNTTETYEDHFTTRSWNSPQDQVDAGYSYFMMPTTTTASYVEEVDYGAVLPGTKVSATLTYTNVVGSTTITPKVSIKLNAGDAWTDYPGVSEVYATNFRYFKITYDFTSAGGNDLLLLTALNLRLDSKLKNDAGTGYANSGDSGGTTVSFNVPFVDVFSISVTPATTTPVIAVYDFVDAPNPTSFKVLLYDTSGTRVSGNFSWGVRGV